MNAPKNSSVPLAFSVMSGVILTILLFQSRYLWIRAYHYDEGHWLMFGVLTNAGYPAYTTTFVGIPPFALWAIQLGHALFGTTLGARYPMVLLSLVGIGSLFWLLQPHQNRFNLVAALLASLTLGFNTLYFIENASLMAEIPAMAWALLSLLLGEIANKRMGNKSSYMRLGVIFLSGLAFGLSLALKLFVIFIPLLFIGGLRIAENSKLRPFAISSLIWFSGVALPWLIFGLIYPPFGLYHETIAFRLALRQATIAQGEDNFSQNVALFTLYLNSNQAWLILALIGAGLTWRYHRARAMLWLAWLACAVPLLMYHIPLRGRYFLLFAPPVAVFASFGLTYTLQWLLHTLKKRVNHRHAEMVIIGLLAVLITRQLAWPLQQTLRPIFIDPHNYIYGNITEPQRAIIDLARQYTLSQDCIVVDDQRVAMAVPRLMPPFLSETSSARHLTQFITTSTVMAQINHYDCPMVVYWDGRFIKYLPDLAAQLRQHYFLEITYDDNLMVYLAQKHVTTPPATALKADFGDNLQLQGITLPPEPWLAGRIVSFATYWQATAHPQMAYKFLLELTPLNQGEQPSINFDQFPFNPLSPNYQFKRGPYYLLPTLDLASLPQAQLADYPARGMLPTNAWPLNQPLRIVSALNLPADLPPGRYQLYLGLYNPDTMTRLPITLPQGQTDKVLLTTTTIK